MPEHEFSATFIADWGREIKRRVIVETELGREHALSIARTTFPMAIFASEIEVTAIAQTTIAVVNQDMSIAISKAKGYTGDECPECGNFTMVRNGTCQKCDSCGTTTGCS